MLAIEGHVLAKLGQGRGRGTRVDGESEVADVGEAFRRVDGGAEGRMRRVRWAITGTAMSGLERRENAPPKCSSASHATSKPSESASAMRSSISAKRSPCDWPGASGVWKKRPNFIGPRHARMTCPNVAAEEASPLSSWCGRIARDRG